ncbi:MAG: chemotaxis protein CheW [Myxococcales bacterium]
MDRGMVEQISDPLVHMIRNAIDHGIETPEDRKAAGKPETGTLRLSACCEGDHIAIELADDGKGLDRDAIVRKAVAQGLVRAEETLADQEVYRLIFLPGFSTAQQVTELSGRGVGMDVVRRNIEGMRGRILIETEKGRGTTFRLLLPLTLAIIDGMLVRCGSERYIIPTLSASESIRPSRDMLVTLGQTGEGLNIRGEILPLMRLSRLFEIPDTLADATQGLVMILEAGGKKVGLLVDEVLSQQKVVIKSLGSAIQNVELVAGAAILFDGTVGLILNADQVVTAATDSKRFSARALDGGALRRNGEVHVQ